MKTYSKLIIFFLSLLISLPAISQNEWTVPERKKNINPPINFDRTQIKAGKATYKKLCASCHGEVGMDNYKQLTPSPNDLGNEQIEANTDGELYFKISNGRTLMPQFAGMLGEMEIWSTIAYVRSFHPDYILQSGMNIQIEVFDGDSVSLEAESLPDSKRIKLRTFGYKAGESYPLEGVAIGISTPRMFGTLQIGKVVETDEYGFAFMDFPAGLPGDEDGMLELTIKLEDAELYGDVVIVEQMKAGAPLTQIDVLEGRHLWSTRDKAPLWVLFSFFGIIIGIWGTIIFIVFKLATIRRIKA